MTKTDVLNLIDQESERLKNMRDSSKENSTMYSNCRVGIKELHHVRGWVESIDRWEVK